MGVVTALDHESGPLGDWDQDEIASCIPTENSSVRAGDAHSRLVASLTKASAAFL
jgi:hypothetical protein